MGNFLFINDAIIKFCELCLSLCYSCFDSASFVSSAASTTDTTTDKATSPSDEKENHNTTTPGVDGEHIYDPDKLPPL